MRIDDECWLAVVDQFQAAAVGEVSWETALKALALITGSRGGELIGLGSAHTIPFHWYTGLEAEWFEEFLHYDGGNPAVNPFIRAGTHCPTLKVLSSAEFVSREERRRNPFLAEHLTRFDTLHACLTPLVKTPETVIGLAVLRSSSEGEINAEQRAVFSSIAPHVRSAVRTQFILENQGAELMAGALESLSMAVFVCDALGRVRSLTPSAETLIGPLGPLRLKGGSLSAHMAADTRTLAEAIRRAGGPRCPSAANASRVMVRGHKGEVTLLEVLPVARRENVFSFDPRVLVLARRPNAGTDSLKLLLTAAYGLTSAETQVALALAQGLAPEQIALQRGAAIGTVRKQTASIYQKLGVHRQSELSALIHRFQ